MRTNVKLGVSLVLVLSVIVVVGYNRRDFEKKIRKGDCEVVSASSTSSSSSSPFLKASGPILTRVKIDKSFGKYATPYVELESGEGCVPRTWNRNVIEGIDYRYLECDSVYNDNFGLRGQAGEVPFFMPLNQPTDNPKVCIINGYYDKAIENAMQYMILPNQPRDLAEAENPVKAIVLRDGMAIWALALELKGDWEKATNVYSALYNASSVEMKWILARKFYAWYLTSPEELAVSRYMLAFEDLCDLIGEYSDFLLVDDIEKKVNCFDKKSRGIPYSKTDPECEGYEQVHELYLFRDRCARIVNPRLHYMCGNDTVKLMMLTRKSYEVFVEEMERYYCRFNKEEFASMHDLTAKAEKALIFLRRVNELPY